ncbi:P2X purinoceptor 4 [Hypsibius exemplaris]|uniref:P2X purinoceptor 4 n=1 Tax=Hypsibius exemplaris TaxID=2072580 RepID=A0A9X6RKT5_HYPEX|nr:P2X purinoceptor 4 [Hypsibius exemplaris]
MGLMDFLNIRAPLKTIYDFGRSFLFEYETPRVVRMRSQKIGLIYRTIQMVLFSYLIGFVFIYSKGYQRFDYPGSSVLTKTKGILQRNLTDGTVQIWDSNDLVVPAQESDAFFIATNILFTDHQVQGVCPEDIQTGSIGIRCGNDSHCAAGIATLYGNGIKTGKCVKSTGTCEISGWCPTETDIAPESPILYGFDSVTVLVKNHIIFRKFNVKRRNILESFSQEYLLTCRFHPTRDPLCPVFALRDMVTHAGESLEEMAGGIIGFAIDWDCDLDYGEDNCLPNYSFRRLDNRYDKIAKGWNFRHTFYYYDADGKARRDLIKFWGIRFVFLVSGRAGKFYSVNFILHVGSSIGLFSCASVICEFLLALTRRSDLLRSTKFVYLEKIKENRRMSSLNSTTAVCNNLNGDVWGGRFNSHGCITSSRRHSLDSASESPPSVVRKDMAVQQENSISNPQGARNREWVYL